MGKRGEWGKETEKEDGERRLQREKVMGKVYNRGKRWER